MAVISGGISVFPDGGGFSLFKEGEGITPDTGIQYVGGQMIPVNGGTVTADHTISLTGGISSTLATGDFLWICYMVANANRAPALTISGNNTGSYARRISILADETTADAVLQTFVKVQSGTPDTILTRSGTGNINDRGILALRAYRNVDQVTPLDLTELSATTLNTGFPDPPSITPVTAGAWVLACGNRATTLTTIANFTTSDLTALQADQTQGFGSGGFHCLALVGHKTDWTSGAVNPAAFTGPSGSLAEGACAVTYVLRPATPG